MKRPFATARLRDDEDIERVQADVLDVIDRTFQLARASVWLRHTRPTAP